MISGANDKCLLISKIKRDETLSSNAIRILTLPADILEIALFPREDYIFASCLDNNIFVVKSDFVNLSFACLTKVNLFETLVSSIVIAPNILQSENLNTTLFGLYVFLLY